MAFLAFRREKNRKDLTSALRQGGYLDCTRGREPWRGKNGPGRGAEFPRRAAGRGDLGRRFLSSGEAGGAVGAGGGRTGGGGAAGVAPWTPWGVPPRIRSLPLLLLSGFLGRLMSTPPRRWPSAPGAVWTLYQPRNQPTTANVTTA